MTHELTLGKVCWQQAAKPACVAQAYGCSGSTVMVWLAVVEPTRFVEVRVAV
jgi:hypothetical protein